MIERLFTIGVYGNTEEDFFRKLEAAGVQTFCDIRRRRGVRGREYAFVNSTYLQSALTERHIAYRYFQNLAPSKELRKEQSAIDARQRVKKRQRQELSENFKRRYAEETLAAFDSSWFAHELGPETCNIVLFCVEANPAACHRSLVAARLQNDWGVTVEHLE